MKSKTIIDIRYYPTEKYEFDRSLNAVGERYARKLRELDFNTGEYDHIYINFDDSLQDGHVKILPQEDWYIHVNIGVSVNKLNSLNPDEKHIFIIKLTTVVLRALCDRDGLDFEVVKKVKNMILHNKTKLEIVHKEKETAKYKVVISYQIRPLNKNSISFIEYIDKIKCLSQKKVLTPLKIYEDIYFLVSSISVTKDVVTLKPRKSSTAEVHLRSYRTPINIPIWDLFSDNERISSDVLLR